MIPQTFQAFLMVEDVGGGEGSGTAIVIFDFETFTVSSVAEIQSGTNYNMTWASGQVYPSSAFSEYGTKSLLFITQEAALNTDAQLPATTFIDFTLEFSAYIDTGGEGLILLINRFLGSSGEANISLFETFVGSGIWTVTVYQEGIGTVISYDAPIVNGVWIKFALVVNKTDDVVSLYIQGTRVDTTDASIFSAEAYPLASLVWGQGGALFTSATYMDNYRFSQGARYINATYTLPIGPFTPD